MDFIFKRQAAQQDERVALGSWTWSSRRVLAGLVCVALWAYSMRSLSRPRNIYVPIPIHRAGHRPTVDYTKLPVGTVQWGNCDGTTDPAEMDCGFIIVPTDYFDESAGVTKIALARYKAKHSRKGIVLVNPGGPGGSGRTLVFRAGRSLQQTYIGEQYDIVGFDPRGIGLTEPGTRCYPKPSDKVFLTINTVLDRSFDVGGNFTDPKLRDSLLRQQVEADALYKAEFERCALEMGEKARYMGTSTVVRDIDFMTKTLEGDDALINFWGGSYGSILGQYLVNMLPDRIGRVTIDGIADAVAWSNEPNYKWYAPWLGSTEAAYSLFLEGCSESGPSVCPLAKKINEEPSLISARIDDFFNTLYNTPMPVPDPEITGIITAGIARTFVFAALQRPSQWVQASIVLAAAMEGNGVLLLKNSRPTATDMQRQAVSCNDALPLKPYEAASNEEIIDTLLEDVKTVTRFAMSVVTTEPDSGCQYWKATPPERFSGPWNHTLRNPIVVFSNTADPVTPISSARLVKKLLGDSAVLALQNGPGHCTLALPSLCTMAKSLAFFANGTLPEDGHICEVTVPAFPGPKFLEEKLSAQELRMLTSVMHVHDVLSEVRRGRTGVPVRFPGEVRGL